MEQNVVHQQRLFFFKGSQKFKLFWLLKLNTKTHTSKRTARKQMWQATLILQEIIQYFLQDNKIVWAVDLCYSQQIRKCQIYFIALDDIFKKWARTAAFHLWINFSSCRASISLIACSIDKVFMGLKIFIFLGEIFRNLPGFHC